jgi:hypothetical protein
MTNYLNKINLWLEKKHKKNSSLLKKEYLNFYDY